MAETYKKDGLVVLGVNAWDEDQDTVRQYSQTHSLKHRLLLDGGSVFAAYHGKRIPCVLWINRQGVVVDVELGFDGPEPLEEKTKQLVQAG